MTDEMKLVLLKQDLGILNSAKDEFLRHLLEMAEELMKREGIIPCDTVEYGGIQRQYAAYLFRKRAGDNTSMPRYLRYELNNLLIHQKGGV